MNPSSNNGPTESQDDQLTIQQAADLLNVSAPYIIKIMGEGDLPFSKVGEGSLIKRSDVVDYKKAQDARSSDALSELTAQAQELGMYH